MRNLDRIGVIQQATETNTNGSITDSWTDYVTYPFAIENQTGNESVNGDKMEAISILVITGRWYPGITAEMRMLYDGLIWNIEGVDELGRKDRLRLTIRQND